MVVKASKSNQMGILRSITPIVISWALWKARCEARMEGGQVLWHGIICFVKAYINDIAGSISKVQKLSDLDLHWLQVMSCPIAPLRRKKTHIVSWRWTNCCQNDLSSVDVTRYNFISRFD